MSILPTRKKCFHLIISFLLLPLACFYSCKTTEIRSFPPNQTSHFPTIKPGKKAEKITFAVFGDNRPASPLLSQPKSFKKILTEIKKNHPDFVISTGDSVYGSADSFTYEKQYREFAFLVKRTKLPFFAALGNHDAQNKAGIKLYKKYISPKTYFFFKIKGVLFIFLDTESQPGRVNKNQLNWLEEILEKSKSLDIFVILHRPPFSLMNPRAEKNKHLSFVDLKNRDQLVSLLKKSKVKAIFAGHEHFFNQSRFQGLTQVITGCAGAPPYTDFAHGGLAHFVLVKMENNKHLEIKVIDENGKSYRPEKFKTPVFP